MAYVSELPSQNAQKPFSPLGADADVLDYQSKLQQSQLDKSAFGNYLLSQAATEALASEPEDAAGTWDAAMQQAADNGVPNARQYIGQYRPDLAQKVQSAFAGGRQNATGTGQAAPQMPPQQMAALAQLPPDKAQQSLSELNMAIEGFNNVQSADDLQAEVQKLTAAGIPVDQIFPGVNFNDKSPLAWQNNYALVHQFINQKALPMRDALQTQVATTAFGLPTYQGPIGELKGFGPNQTILDQTGRVVGTTGSAPPQEPWEVVAPTTTGGRSVLFNKATGQYVDPQNAGTGTDAAYQQFAQAINAAENGTGNPSAKNPNSSATGNGQFINSTWLQTARQAFPALANVPDAQLLQMRNLPGFSQDMTVALAKNNAVALQGANLPVTGASLALAHRLGVSDAEKVMTAAPTAKLSSVLSPAVMQANPQLKNLTAAQYIAQAQQQFGNEPIAQNSPFGGQNDQQLDAPDPSAREILGQTGLTFPAFMLLTGTGSQLARDKATRTQATMVADQFAKQRGVDVSTFKSQYEANNQILQNNMKRYNQSKIMENEVLGTVQNLGPVANQALLGNVTAANLADLWAGKQVNNPVIQEYAVYLDQLRNELAGYFGALAGRGTGSSGSNRLTDRDFEEAQTLIQSGISNRGLGALQNAIIGSTAKMNRVLERSINDAQKNVWGLFGIGQNYKAQYPTDIPPAMVQMLQKNPTSQRREQFDEAFGGGQAARILNK